MNYFHGGNYGVKCELERKKRLSVYADNNEYGIYKTSKMSNVRVRGGDKIVIVTEYENPISFEKTDNIVNNQTGEIVHLFDYTQQIEIDFETKKENNNIDNYFKKLNSNFNQKRDNFIDLVNANLDNNTYFLTLTYNDTFVKYKADFEAIKYDFKMFMRRFKRTFDYAPKYLATQELQKKNNRNAWHFHILLFDQKRLDINVLRDCWGMGAINLKKVNYSSSGIGKYMSKYLLKDIDDLVSHKKSYFSSRNLKRPYIAYSLDNIDLSKFDIESKTEYRSSWFGNCKQTIYKIKNL